MILRDGTAAVHPPHLPPNSLRPSELRGTKRPTLSTEILFDRASEDWFIVLPFTGEVRILTRLLDYAMAQSVVYVKQGTSSHITINMWKWPVVSGTVSIDGVKVSSVPITISAASRFFPNDGMPPPEGICQEETRTRRAGKPGAQYTFSVEACTDGDGAFQVPLPFTDHVGIVVVSKAAWPEVWRFDLLDRNSSTRVDLFLKTTEPPGKPLQMIDRKTRKPLREMRFRPNRFEDPHGVVHPILTTDEQGRFFVHGLEDRQDYTLIFEPATKVTSSGFGKSPKPVEFRYREGAYFFVEL
jgi:hypothetical protein